MLYSLFLTVAMPAAIGHAVFRVAIQDHRICSHDAIGRISGPAGAALKLYLPLRPWNHESALLR
jgi:hypothetical protein